MMSTEPDTILRVEWKCGTLSLSAHPQSANEGFRADVLDDIEAAMVALCVEHGPGGGLAYERLNELRETIRSAAREWQRLADGSRSSVEQLRAETGPEPHVMAGGAFDPIGTEPPSPPTAAMEARLARLETARAGIVRDYEIRQGRQLLQRTSVRGTDQEKGERSTFGHLAPYPTFNPTNIRKNHHTVRVRYRPYPMTL